MSWPPSGATGSSEKAIGLQALANPRVLFLAAVYFTNVCLLNFVLFFLPLILKGLGISDIQTGFVAAIPSLFALIAVIWWGRRSDRRLERSGHAAFANLLAGAALLSAALLVDPTSRIVAVTIAFAATLAFTPPFGRYRLPSYRAQRRQQESRRSVRWALSADL